MAETTLVPRVLEGLWVFFLPLVLLASALEHGAPTLVFMVFS